MAFALAINLGDTSSSAPVLITTTLSLVLFTIVVFGGGTFPLMKLLERYGFATHRSEPGGKPKEMTLSGGLDRAARDVSGEDLAGDEAASGRAGSANWFERWDSRYFVPFLRSRANVEVRARPSARVRAWRDANPPDVEGVRPLCRSFRPPPPQMYRAAQAEFHELSMAWSENANVEPSEELLVVPDSATDGPGDPDGIDGAGAAGGSASSGERAMSQSAERRRMQRPRRFDGAVDGPALTLPAGFGGRANALHARRPALGEPRGLAGRRGRRRRRRRHRPVAGAGRRSGRAGPPRVWAVRLEPSGVRKCKRSVQVMAFGRMSPVQPCTQRACSWEARARRCHTSAVYYANAVMRLCRCATA